MASTYDIPTAPYPRYLGVAEQSPSVEPCDPRETGNHLARLQVASEIVASLLARSRSIADRVNDSGHAAGKELLKDAHMSLLRFPDDIIAAAKEAHIHLNRIEGALGV